VAKIRQGRASKKGEPVVFAVAVKVRVETRTCGKVEHARGRKRGVAEWSLGGDVNDVGRIETPPFEQAPANGKPQPHQRITGDRETRIENFLEEPVATRLITRMLARANNGNLVAPETQSFDQLKQGHGDPVDLRQKRFGNEREFQGTKDRQIGSKVRWAFFFRRAKAKLFQAKILPGCNNEGVRRQESGDRSQSSERIQNLEFRIQNVEL
jgi:hypothetical protein